MQTKFFIGTSGWNYFWNPDGLEWYLKNSKLNSIELNASFYRFPFPSMVTSWAKKTKEINKEVRWSIKVNRLITHVFKFDERAFQTWKKFEKLFAPLKDYIDFYLFQIPPNLTSKSLQKIEGFIKKTKLKEKFALEVRNLDLFNEASIEWASRIGITFVSVDAPYFTNFPRDIFCTSENVYLRMHGRSEWYSYDYSRNELKEILEKIENKNKNKKIKKAYIFFNNNHGMLKNAQELKSLVEEWKGS
ncbi:MAG: DUF72 domain-containing protein [Candidatus Micrarchaeia archaeon]